MQAADLRDAVKKLDEGMKGTMADYQIGSVSETPIMDVYPYEADKTDNREKRVIHRNYHCAAKSGTVGFKIRLL